MQSSAVFSVFATTTQFCELDGKILSGAKSIYSHNKLHLNDEHECSILGVIKPSFFTTSQAKPSLHMVKIFQANPSQAKATPKEAKPSQAQAS